MAAGAPSRQPMNSINPLDVWAKGAAPPSVTDAYGNLHVADNIDPITGVVLHDQTTQNPATAFRNRQQTRQDTADQQQNTRFQQHNQLFGQLQGAVSGLGMMSGSV